MKKAFGLMLWTFAGLWLVTGLGLAGSRVVGTVHGKASVDRAQQEQSGLFNRQRMRVGVVPKTRGINQSAQARQLEQRQSGLRNEQVLEMGGAGEQTHVEHAQQVQTGVLNRQEAHVGVNKGSVIGGLHNRSRVDSMEQHQSGLLNAQRIDTGTVD